MCICSNFLWNKSFVNSMNWFADLMAGKIEMKYMIDMTKNGFLLFIHIQRKIWGKLYGKCNGFRKLSEVWKLNLDMVRINDSFNENFNNSHENVGISK